MFYNENTKREIEEEFKSTPDALKVLLRALEGERWLHFYDAQIGQNINITSPVSNEKYFFLMTDEWMRVYNSAQPLKWLRPDYCILENIKRLKKVLGLPEKEDTDCLKSLRP